MYTVNSDRCITYRHQAHALGFRACFELFNTVLSPQTSMARAKDWFNTENLIYPQSILSEAHLSWDNTIYSSCNLSHCRSQMVTRHIYFSHHVSCLLMCDIYNCLFCILLKYCFCLCGVILKLNYVGAEYAWLVVCETMTFIFFVCSKLFFGL